MTGNGESGGVIDGVIDDIGEGIENATGDGAAMDTAASGEAN